MSYSVYRLTRQGAAAPALIFFDTPPLAEGFYDLPRQNFKTSQVELGTVNIDYGIDPGNQTLKLTFQGVPEVVLSSWMAEYTDPNSVDMIYTLSDHRQKPHLVKWKAMVGEYLRTLPQDDVRYWLDYYTSLFPPQPGNPLAPQVNSNDPLHGEIADLYKVTMEFFVIPG